MSRGEEIMDKLIIVSADGHAGPTAAAYRDYLEPRYRDGVETLIAEEAQYVAAFEAVNTFPPEVLEVIDPDGAITSGGLAGAWDPVRRLKELDREGVSAEIILPGHQLSTLPYFSIVNRTFAADYRDAGARAYHRWLADCMTQGDGRFLGVGEPGSCHDMESTLRELHWLADRGFVSVGIPGTVADADLPPLVDAYYEPFWAACADLDLVLSVHAGFGHPQGTFFMMADHMASSGMTPEDVAKMVDDSRAATEGPAVVQELGGRRVLWQLILSGIFDRYPSLKLVMTELRADWVPATLAQLDQRFEREGLKRPMKPSEYFRRNCAVAPSSTRKSEIAMRQEIGVQNILFGTDYPHPEGTWPNTREWIADAFIGVPVDEARAILGENAINWYKLDRAKLARVAEEIGPSPSDLLGQSAPVSAKVLQHFHRRSGYSHGPEVVDAALLDQMFSEDLSSLARFAGGV
jgi:predicted TIM-barrel fold metal-dependent hydrolase